MTLGVYMKQSESDKMLGRILRDASKKYGWKTSRGFVFKKDSQIFFTILINGQSKTKRLSWSICFKLYDFDDLFWKIVKLEENSKQPLSFRACGAWVTPSMEVKNDYHILDEWNEKNVSKKVNDVIEEMDSLSSDISISVTSPESNLLIVEKYYKSLMEKYPNAVKNIWVERLLTCILLGKYVEAKNIANSRIKENDSGGFNYTGNSFYELANEFIEKTVHT